MHGGNVLKFCMLLYLDHFQNWLVYGHSLLIFLILAIFWLSEAGQIWGFQPSPGEHMEGMAWIVLADVSWPSSAEAYFKAQYYLGTQWLLETAQGYNLHITIDVIYQHCQHAITLTCWCQCSDARWWSQWTGSTLVMAFYYKPHFYYEMV